MNTAEISRLLANLLKKGEVSEVDPAGAMVRVQCGELTTAWLPYFVPAAGGVSVHRPPSVGETALMLSPSGETADALVLCGWSGSAHPSPGSDSDSTVVQYPDGARSEYNHASGAMKISGIKTGHIEAAEKITLDTPETVVTQKLTVNGLLTYTAGMAGTGGSGATATITGDIKIKNGNIDMQDGGIKITGGDVVADSISLKTHTHPVDGSDTGEPQ